ncbi:MAG: winged helix-turn-helix transcriptional regulator [Candidatus Woesearchaeota archaeon]
MKKIEFVFRNILEELMEKKNKSLTQAEIARALKISLSTVSLAISHLRKMNAVKVKKRSFEIVNGRKILLYWASIRDLNKDIIYKTRVEKSIIDIEKNMPSAVVYGGYSAYKFLFHDMPADYSEVYVYSDDLNEIKKRFKENKNEPNLFVLKKEFEKMSLAHLFVDLWNLKEWYAKDFLKVIEEKINGILE